MNNVEFDELVELVDGDDAIEAGEVCELADRKVAQYPLYN